MEKIKILLVDDDRQSSLFLIKFLQAEGFEVVYAENGRAGWECFSSHFWGDERGASPHLVLLDINMPEMNGFELAQRIRQQNNDVLIFFLTDRTEKADRLKGFSLKGNDYIPKPFYPEELIAKIHERFDQPAVKPTAEGGGATHDDFLRIGQTLFNRNLSTIEYRGQQHHLTTRQADILAILAQHINRTVERDLILNRVWGNNSYANSLALNVQISYLRKKLSADAYIAIISQKKYGLRLQTC